MSLTTKTIKEKTWEFFFSNAQILRTEANSLECLVKSFPGLQRHNHLISSQLTHVEGLELRWRSRHRQRRGYDVRCPTLLDPLWTFSKMTSLHLDGCPCPLGGMGRLKALRVLFLERIPCLSEDIGLLCNLEMLSLQNCGGDLSFSMIQGLTSLKTLRLRMDNSFRLCTCNLVGLKDLNNLQRLQLSGISSTTIFDLFAEPWNGSKILKIIEASNFSLGNDYAKILPGLPEALEELKLDDNRITDLNAFATIGLPKGIRRLHVAGGSMIVLYSEQRQYLNELLDRYPQQVSIPSEFLSFRDRGVTRLFCKMLVNQSGRVLLENMSQSIPLSVWPLILELAVNRNFSREKDALDSYFGLLGATAAFESDGFRFLQSLEVTASILFRLVRTNPAWMTGR
jgi:hypothetical protein